MQDTIQNNNFNIQPSTSNHDALDSPIWFSHKEERYDAELKESQRKIFHWTGETQMWEWNNCVASWIKTDSANMVKVIIRSAKKVFSEYRKRDVVVRYMLGFDIDGSKIQPPFEERHREPIDNLKKEYGEYKTRWALRLDKDHYIWQWKEEGRAIESSEVYRIYAGILKTADEPFVPEAKRFFNVEAHKPTDDRKEDSDKIIPVIYQTAIDSWKNFVREIHCSQIKGINADGNKMADKIQVSILFNNEELREHAIANRVYEWFRSWFYGRIIDVETFYIVLDENDNNSPAYLDFPNIYSSENTIQADSVHINKLGVKIKYFYGDSNHPIVFVNTSNHAMGEHDTNHRLWKWEYIAWEKDSSILFGEKSREDIEKTFRPKLLFWKK
jgi:hypothetical protein